MALIKCRDCKKDVSSDAIECIHCGAVQNDSLREIKKMRDGMAKSMSKIFIDIFK